MKMNYLQTGKRARKAHKILSSEEEEEETEQVSKFYINVSENRIIFHGPITQHSCFKLISSIHEVEDYVDHTRKHCDGKIYININSDGGEIYPALSVVETIRRCRYEVVTICEGVVASAAVLISLAGGKRIIGKHSYMMIHEIRHAAWGKFTELKDDMKNGKKLMKDMKSYMKERSNRKLPEEGLDDLLKHDIIWSSKKCLKYGLVDEIV